VLRVRVLIAPDCFGGSLTAAQAAAAIAAGWRSARPADTLRLAPQSDGGPGFVEVLAAQPGMQRHRARVSGPLGGAGGGEVHADWALHRASATAFIECAQACGLSLLGTPPAVSTALAAHSRGVGQLIDAALRAGARTVVVGLGGSACTDGGRAMVDALGGWAAATRRLAGVSLIAATDVDNPLLGPEGAARTFGPQKGADPATVALLERRLSGWAEELVGARGRGVVTLPGAGAAGGIGAALLALGGRRLSGADVIAAHTALDAQIDAADLVVTGEGRLDAQSLRGKVVGSLARRARRAGVPVLVLAGQISLAGTALTGAGVAAAYALADHSGSVRRAIEDAAAQLTDLARVTAAGLAGE